jgi:hypothetical protein
LFRGRGGGGGVRGIQGMVFEFARANHTVIKEEERGGEISRGGKQITSRVLDPGVGIIHAVMGRVDVGVAEQA